MQSSAQVTYGILTGVTKHLPTSQISRWKAKGQGSFSAARQTLEKLMWGAQRVTKGGQRTASKLPTARWDNAACLYLARSGLYPGKDTWDRFANWKNYSANRGSLALLPAFLGAMLCSLPRGCALTHVVRPARLWQDTLRATTLWKVITTCGLQPPL